MASLQCINVNIGQTQKRNHFPTRNKNILNIRKISFRENLNANIRSQGQRTFSSHEPAY